ncbi:tubulin-tyrosine ligase family-domain-containing protein, partial [Baffinella frigidus]
LAMNLNRMMKQLPAEYDFVPDTWILPEDTLAFVKNRRIANGLSGQGIFLTRKAADIPKEGRYVAQRYLNKPLLIDGLNPLRLFVADEGLARFCTEEYQGVSNKNVDKQFMHLTNYAINKLNEDFEDGGNDGDAGSKRSITVYHPEPLFFRLSKPLSSSSGAPFF